MKHCPVCQNKLVTKTMHSQQIDECPNQHGLWIDHGELTAMLKVMQAIPARPVPQPNAAVVSLQQRLETESICCPNCATNVRPLVYAYDSGIIVHRCNQCQGSWMHSDKLAEIAAYQKASPKVNTLAEEIGGRYQSQHRWLSFYETIRSKKVFGIAGSMYLIFAVLYGGSAQFFQTLGWILCSWLLIWTSDFSGNSVGLYRGFGDRQVITRPLGFPLAFYGLVILLLPVLQLLFD